ncbi:hypothetical protein [Acinetobacter calcoaceticus]|uniref:hypothetical protein n=1 Tax=Acinetobacter calcoaceticus TaxID=471 RepID=UPI0012BA7ADE|nr:hypothetical protein [Acinetobacter calcoaceticus]
MSFTVFLMMFFEVIKVSSTIVLSGGNNGLLMLCILQTLVIGILVIKLTVLNHGD